jgi:pantothenate kinase type III
MRWEDAVAVADFGTAITIDFVDQTAFCGGIIAPVWAGACLHEQTAQLPLVHIHPVHGACGSIPSMRSMPAVLRGGGPASHRR